MSFDHKETPLTQAVDKNGGGYYEMKDHAERLERALRYMVARTYFIHEKFINDIMEAANK